MVWRFVLVPQAQRPRLADAFAAALLERDATALPEQLEQAREKAHRSPVLLLAVVDGRRGDPAVGLHERILSAGCAVQNLLLMATALGFGSALTSGQALCSQALRAARHRHGGAAASGHPALDGVASDRCPRRALPRQLDRAARDVLRYFDIAAPLHHEDEELHVFPPLLERGGADAVAAVRRLQQDHEAMSANWQAARALLLALAEGRRDAFGSEDETVLERFAGIYAEHIRIEEEVVYPSRKRWCTRRHGRCWRPRRCRPWARRCGADVVPRAEKP